MMLFCEVAADYIKHFFLVRINNLRTDFYVGMTLQLFKVYHTHQINFASRGLAAEEHFSPDSSAKTEVSIHQTDYCDIPMA